MEPPVLSCSDSAHHTLGSTNIRLLDGLATRAAHPSSLHSFICKMGATLGERLCEQDAGDGRWGRGSTRAGRDALQRREGRMYSRSLSYLLFPIVKTSPLGGQQSGCCFCPTPGLLCPSKLQGVTAQHLASHRPAPCTAA